MYKTLVFAATYNGVGNIKVSIRKIFKYSKNVDILIIDDSGPDGTADVLKKIQKKIKS